MVTSSFVSSCLAFPSARSGAGEFGGLPTCHRRLPLAWCHRGRAGTPSPCHGGTSWASSKFSLSSNLLCTLLELVMAMLHLSDALGFLPYTCSRAVELGLAVMCVIQAL
jgi:hypothetical protein